MITCKVYRSERHAESYLYLREDIEFSDLPAQLQERFGQPGFVLQLQLTAQRKLSRVDVTNVIKALEDEGYFLQLPPNISVEEELTRRFS